MASVKLHSGQVNQIADDLASASTEHLLARLHDAQSAPTRSALLEALVARRSAVEVQGLLKLLRTQNGFLRIAVVEALQQMPELVHGEIDALLRDEDPEVRIFTIALLETLDHPAIRRWLLAVLEQDANPHVCAAAIDLLGEVGDHSAVAPLRAVKARFPGVGVVAFAVDVALGQID
jgi:HEAT repeat protein